MNDVATLDFGRFERRGYPEAVFCLGKSVDQVRAIARMWRTRTAESTAALGTVLFTRATPEQLAAVAEELDGASIDETARLAAWPAEPPAATGGRVVVVCAGTSDLPGGPRSRLTARHLGPRR